MSQSDPTVTRAKWLRSAAVTAVVLVPLAFAGLFVSALAHANTAVTRIPAAIVNGDTLVYLTAADGTKKPIFAGRQLVTKLTGDSKGFDWTITNRADAERALANGSIDAILTIPQDFSSSILSLNSTTPKRANLAIHTDDSHSYLTGAVAQAVGDGMVNAFGKTITEQYISGIYTSVGTLGGSLSTAADGASSLATAASGLSGGLSTLFGGATSASSGAKSLTTGITAYTGGLDGLSSGLGQLDSAAANLPPLSQQVSGVTGRVAALAAELKAATAGAQDPVTIARISGLLSSAVGDLTPLAAQNSALAGGVQSGVAQSASGAAQLSAGSAGLRSGVSSLASGLVGVSSGAASASSGASQLETGASRLAAGLATGAAQLPAGDSAAAARSAKIAADPVGLTLTRGNKISDIGQVIASFFVPLGLWVGALAIFLVLRPVTRRALSSTAANGRLVLSTLARASAISVAQALLLVALLHVSLGVAWASLPATLGFALIMALAFMAFHYLLTIAFGRAGLVISLLALAIQVTSTGGLYPVQLLAMPFQWISPLLPLTYAVQGMQGIIAGGDAGPVITSALMLFAFGVGSVLIALLAIARTRRAESLVLGLRPRPSSSRPGRRSQAAGQGTRPSDLVQKDLVPILGVRKAD